MGAGLANMGGAVLSDVVASPVRALVPGGREGYEGSQILSQIAQPLVESFAGTAQLVGSLPLALVPGGGGDSSRERLGQAGRAFSDNPGLFALEHVGNVALGGSLVSRPLAAGARSAAGLTKPTKASVASQRPATLLDDAPGVSRSSVRAHRRAQLTEIADSAGPGQNLARAAIASRDIVGRPYTAVLRRGIDTRLPGLTSAGLPRASLSEIAGQVRDASPTGTRLADGSMNYSPIEPTSPIARKLRSVADQPLPQALAQQVGSGARGARRLTEGMMDQVRRGIGERARDTHVGRTSDLHNQLRMARREGLQGWDDPALDLPRWDKVTPEQAARAAEVLSRMPDEALPTRSDGAPSHLARQRDELVLDLYERAAGLEPGAVSEQLRMDLELQQRAGTRQIDQAEGVRIAQRELQQAVDEGKIAPEVLEGLPSDMVVPEAQLAPAAQRRNRPDYVNEAMERIRREHTVGESRLRREIELGERGFLVGEEALGGTLARRQADGSWAAPEPGATPRPMSVAPTAKARKALTKLEGDLKGARRAHAALEDRAASGRLIPAEDTAKAFNRLARDHTKIARSLDDPNLPAEHAARALDDLTLSRRALEELAQERGIRLPDQFVQRLDEVETASHLGERGVMAPAARNLDEARQRMQEPLIRLDERASVSAKAIERSNARVQRIEQVLSEMNESALLEVGAAPAVARPALTVGRAGPEVASLLESVGKGDLVDQLGIREWATTVQQLDEAGVTPGFIRRLAEGTSDSTGVRDGVAPGRVSAGKERGMGDLVREGYDRTRFRQDIELATARIADAAFEEATRRYARTSEALWDELGMDKARYSQFTPRQRAEALMDRGFVRWEPKAAFPSRTTAPNDLWVHRGVQDGLEAHLAEGVFEILRTQALEPAARGWKSVVLAMRPAWQVNNAIGNSVMAMFRGQIDPLDYFRIMATEAPAALRRHRLGLDPVDGRIAAGVADDLIQTRLSRMTDDATGVDAASGAPQSVEQALAQTEITTGSATTGFRAGVKRWTTGSYQLNNYVDNLNRLTVMIANADGPGGVHGALALAEQSLGDYSKMTGTERRYVRTLFPFWAWQRHIMKLTFSSFGATHITRTSMMAHVGTLAADQDEWREMLLDYQQGNVRLGDSDNFVQMRGMNPFQDAIEPFMRDDRIAPLAGFASTANPLFQTALERTSGIKAFTGRPFTRAVPRQDEWGRPINEPPNLARHLFQNLAPPQIGVAQDLGRRALGRPTARYDSGEPILREGARERPVWQRPAALFGANIAPTNMEALAESSQRVQSRLQGRQADREEQIVEAYRNASLPNRLIPGS